MNRVSRSFQITVQCPPDAVAALVFDPAAYAVFDDRVAEVAKVEIGGPDDGIELRVWYRPRMPGSRLPEPIVELHYRSLIHGDTTTVEQALAPWPANRLNHLLGCYRARLMWRPAPEGCLIEREVSYELRLLADLSIGRLLRRRLGPSIEAEMLAVKAFLEADGRPEESDGRQQGSQ